MELKNCTCCCSEPVLHLLSEPRSLSKLYKTKVCLTNVIQVPSESKKIVLKWPNRRNVREEIIADQSGGHLTSGTSRQVEHLFLSSHRGVYWVRFAHSITLSASLGNLEISRAVPSLNTVVAACIIHVLD